MSALQKATRLAHETLPPEERSALTRAMLADEAFALHFIEDTYAAGHVAGTWGDVSQRKGTHDYYNENGLEVSTWEGGAKTVVLMGDAHMRPEDAQRAAESVRLSLEQLLDTAVGGPRTVNLPHTPRLLRSPKRSTCARPTGWSRGPRHCKPHPKLSSSVSRSCGRLLYRVWDRGWAPCRVSEQKSVRSSV